MRRLRDWDTRLLAFVRETRAEPFAWSTQDCATWALRAADMMCGSQHADAMAGQYDDETGALTYALSRGWKTGFDACRQFFGDPLSRPSFTQRGDILYRGLTEFPFGTLLVCVSTDRLMGPGPHGLESIPYRAALTGTMTAFAVGR